MFSRSSFSPVSFGPSWGLTWEAAQDNLEPEPGGHWKHLFQPAYACVAPTVKAESQLSWRVALPDVYRIALPACPTETTYHCRASYRVELPFVGSVSSSVGEECNAAFRVLRPSCGAIARGTVRHRIYGKHRTSAPSTGVCPPLVHGFIPILTYTDIPEVVLNPSDEELIALLY